MNASIFDENTNLKSIAHKLLQAREQGLLLLQSGDLGFASAPSNIALLKYWGKMQGHRQIPVNSSLSLTLGNFRATTQVQVVGRFFPLENGHPVGLEHRPVFTLELNKRVQPMPAKMEQFLKNLLHPYAVDVGLHVQSENNFPTACGVASSAAGYAALVAAVADVLNLQRFLSEEELSLWLCEWSRLGSGSATRSAIRPDVDLPSPSGTSSASAALSKSAAALNQFVAWDLKDNGASLQPTSTLTQTYACSVHPRFENLRHCLLVLDSSEKAVGSSEGHALAVTSPLQQVRLAHYPTRFHAMKKSLLEGDLSAFALLTESDAFEMHAVMGTGAMPLNYMTAQTALAIRELVEQRQRDASEMFWTLDAGANPHILYETQSAKSLAHYFERIAEHPALKDARVLLPGRAESNALLIGFEAVQRLKREEDSSSVQPLLLDLPLLKAAETLLR